MGPETGCSRREALRRLLEIVEIEIGKTVLRDARRKNEGGGVAEWIRPSGLRMESSNEGWGRERDVASAGSAASGRVRREEADQRDMWESGSKREGSFVDKFAGA